MAGDFDANGNKWTPVQKRRRVERQKRVNKANALRAKWTLEQFAEEEERIHLEVQSMLAERHAA